MADKFFDQYDFVYPMEKPKLFLGRNEETDMLVETLLKTRMRNAILVGDAGVGKTIIVQKAAELLKGKFLFAELDIAGSMANTQLRGEFETKMTSIIKAAIVHDAQMGNQPLVFFIDEIHTIYKAGAVEGGSLDMGNILKRWLALGKITIIGATTPKEYDSCILRDSALARRLSPIFVKELDDETTLSVIRKFSHASIKDDVLKHIILCTKKLKPQGMRNPDCAIEITDRCMARSIHTGEFATKEMVDSIASSMLMVNMMKDDN